MSRRPHRSLSGLVRALSRPPSAAAEPPPELPPLTIRLPEIPPPPEPKPLTVSRFKQEPELIFPPRRRRRSYFPSKRRDGSSSEWNDDWEADAEDFTQETQEPGSPSGTPQPPSCGHPPGGSFLHRAKIVAMSWLRSTALLWLAAFLFPPVGLILLWLRSTRLRWKLLGTLGIAVLAVLHLYYFWGLRWQLDGSGSRLIFSFGDRERHERVLEASRRAALSAPPPATVATPPPAAPEPTAVHASAAPPPVAPAAPPPYWTDFRGPGRLGHYTEQPILLNWPASGLPRLWRQPVGAGYASFVVGAGSIFTIEQRRDKEVVAAYDAATGRELWTNSWPGHFSEAMGGDGPRTTPVLDDTRLYALGAEGEFRCLDAATGKVLWRKNILTENGASNLVWAQSASPLIVDDKVIVLPGGPNGKSVVAYNKLTGATVWTSQNDEQSYTAPMLVHLAGKRQLLVVSALRAMGLDPDTGRLLWDYPWVTEYHINAAQPIVTAPNRFFISAGYGHGAAVVELSPDGDRFTARTVWQNTRMKNKFNSSVLHDGYIYGLDEAILACIDASTGELKWKGGRYGYGQLLLASGHLIVLTERGEVVLVKADPSAHQELARFPAIEGKTWNHPAISGGILFVRNNAEMAAFRIAR